MKLMILVQLKTNASLKMIHMPTEKAACIFLEKPHSSLHAGHRMYRKSVSLWPVVLMQSFASVAQ